MPEIQIRPVVDADIPYLIALNHHYTSDHVWQMEYRLTGEENPLGEQERTVSFRQVRLPRAVRVEYPYSPRALASDWTRRSGILVALLGEKPIGYASLILNALPQTTWVTDLVVDRPLRRQGIGTALLLACQEWAANMDSQHLVLETQPKNYPAIQLALRLGFEFCGYNDRYYPNNEIGIFFGKSLH
jgi:ribosomal protein S18 acetylase RimI-like enzyme